MPNQVVSAMTALLERWTRYQQSSGGLPVRQHEPDWCSPCESVDERSDWVQWRPVSRLPIGDMDNIASGLDMVVHPDLAAYYGGWFAGPMAFLFKGLRIEPVLPWNQQDYERLQENLIGHALMQRRLRLPATFFLAATRRDSHLISLDNDSGTVLYEMVGRAKSIQLAQDLASFLDRLEPLRWDQLD